VVAMLKKYGNDQIIVDAGISGLKGQEAQALTELLATPNPSADAVEMLSGAAAKARDAGQMEKLIAAATNGQHPEKLRLAVLNGANTGLIGADARRNSGTVAGGRAGGVGGLFERPRARVKPLAVSDEPVALISLSKESGEMAGAPKAVVDNLTWPGKPVPPAPKNTRTAEEEALFKAGLGVYATNCAGCHQDQGQG